MAASVVSVLRATHRIDLDERTWAKGVTEALYKLLPRQRGVKTFFYGVDPSKPFSFEAIVDTVPNVSPATAHPYMTPESMTYVYASQPRAEYGLGYLRESDGQISSQWQDILADEGAADFFAFCMPDVSRGLHIAVLTKKPARTSIERREMFLALARQVTNQLRLRRLLVDEASERVVFDAEGRCLHAEGQGRELETQARLRKFLELRDEAKRATDEGQSVASLKLWESVLNGEYSFLDQYEAGTRRIIAIRTPPEVKALRRLTVKERAIVANALKGEANKVAALELGLPESSVATLLGRSLAKMGLPDRVALVRVYQYLLPYLG